MEGHKREKCLFYGGLWRTVDLCCGLVHMGVLYYTNGVQDLWIPFHELDSFMGNQ